ncbi:MAG: shikimate kinase [Ferruginibacter sp.]
MGSGKTHWGRIWAAKHKIAFLDLDEQIEVSERKSVAEIFEAKGEDYFREVEARILRNHVFLNDTIVACGGGTPCFHNNMEWMNKYGTTVYITCTPDEILRRINTSGKNKRPLLSKVNQAELLFFIEKKLKERQPFYGQAKVVLANSKITENTFANHVKPMQSILPDV